MHIASIYLKLASYTSSPLKLIPTNLVEAELLFNSNWHLDFVATKSYFNSFHYCLRLGLVMLI